MKNCTKEDCTKIMFQKELCSMHYNRLYRHGDMNKTNRGLTPRNHPLYNTYANMKDRCYNQNTPSYPRYGGRGIKVCDRWLQEKGIDNFIADIGKKPKGTSLDRINNDGDYTPDNCKWSTINQQMGNTRRNNKIVGVHWSKKDKAWIATLTIDKRTVLWKQSKDYDKAVIARKEAERKYLT